MTRKRLRPAHGAEDLARIYARPHDHSEFPDHHLRVAATIDLARWVTERHPATSAADLSCGNGAILRALDIPRAVYGDFAAGYEVTGPIEETIERIDPVDLFVCSETIEHLDEPEKVLAQIRAKAKTLVLSTPVDAWFDDNPEHYWAWSREDMQEMLAAAGFQPIVYASVDFRDIHPQLYQFGIWGVR